MPNYGTFELLADVSREELTEIGYTKTLLAQNFVPATKPVGLALFLLGFEGFWTGTSARYWHEPITGMLMLRPNVLEPGFWTSDAFESDKLGLADFQFTAGDFEEQRPQIIDSVACSPFVYTTHTNTASVMDPLAGLAITVHGSANAPPDELLHGGSSSDYAYLLRTQRTWARNEGFAFQVITSELAMASSFPEYGVQFGKRYALLLGTAGRAELWRNEHAEEDDEGVANEWRLLSNLDYNASIDGQNQSCVTVMVVPFSEKYIGIHIGPGLSNANWAGASGSQDVSPSRRYLVQVGETSEYDEASEVPEDPQTKNGLFKILPPDRITFWGRKMSQFHLGFYKLRYPATTQTMYLAPEDLGQLYPDEPEWNAYGARNRGLCEISTVNVDATAWDPLEDRKMVGKIEMDPGVGLDSESAAGEPIYSPEVHFATAEVDPTIELVERTEADWTQRWQMMVLSRSAGQVTGLEIRTIFDEYFWSWWRRHSFPIKLVLRDDYSATDYALFAGTVIENESLFKDKVKIGLELLCVDGWQELRKNHTWDSPIWDGVEAYKPLRWALNNSGVPDSRIYVSEAALTILLPEADTPQNYTYRAAQGEDCEAQARRILDAGLEITMRERYAETGWTAIDGETELTEEDYVWVIDLRPVFVDEETTPVVAKFWLDQPAGVAWGTDASRMAAPGGNLKATEIAPAVRGPEGNVLTLDCPSSSGKSALRHSVANIVNFDSITNPAHRDFTGRKIRMYRSAATHGSKTPQDLTLIARNVNDEEMHMQELISMQGEYRPWILEDTFVELYARNPLTTFIEKLGVYRVAEATPKVAFAQLVTIDTSYVLEWVAEGEEYLDPNQEEED